MKADNTIDVIIDIPVSPSLAEELPPMPLASPWRRIGAVLINLVIFGLVVFPFSFSSVNMFVSRPVPDPNIDSMTVVYDFYHPILSNFVYGSLLSLIILIWQWIWMGRYGQSIGKRLLGIRVVDLEGRNPGFNGTVLVREVSFCFLIYFGLFISLILIQIVNFLGLPLIGVILGNIYYIFCLCVPLICLVMLFFLKTQRRTLQDMLAKTKVVYQPKP